MTGVQTCALPIYTEVRRYDRAVKLLQEAPQLTPQLKADLQEQIRWPTKARYTLGGFDESGRVEGYAYSEKYTFELQVEEELRELQAKDPRYRRLSKTFRCWPAWKDTMAALARG